MPENSYVLVIVRAENVKRVAVRASNWVGDAAMNVPALRELRRILPAANIALCVRPQIAGLFEDADFVDEILICEKQNSAFQTLRARAKEWRKRKFNAAILFPNSFEAALLAKLGGARVRVGYKTDGRAFLLTHPLAVPAWKNERHEIFYYLNIVAALEKRLSGKTEVWEREPDARLVVSEKRKQSAREILRANGANLSKKTIALCPGSTNSRAKRWHASSYARLADLIQKNSSANVILIGSPDELEVSREVYEKSEIKPILLTGKTNLSEAVAILSVTDLLVSNDTGPAHIAPAVGTPTIVLFGPTIPTTTRPFSDLAEIARKPPQCAPCMLRDCPIDHRCMTAITPEEIFLQIKNSELRMKK